MKKLLAVVFIALIMLSSCGRRVYLNESNKITVSKKKTMSPRPRASSDVWIALLIAVPNLIFFGSTISDQNGH
ncbi:hypothetical protein QQ020_20180 [Fulvivirgaceae bacterium BMA12]|uniref:Lipoprotein n=1 Tax=Agaribacillus aureus TaxID=3051825 RepID=A0ABT8L9H3_9BACT|nr:hypothetical protein [Fulvivirgaceae bacterium BMA12]